MGTKGIKIKEIRVFQSVAADPGSNENVFMHGTKDMQNYDMEWFPDKWVFKITGKRKEPVFIPLANVQHFKIADKEPESEPVAVHFSVERTAAPPVPKPGAMHLPPKVEKAKPVNKTQTKTKPPLPGD